jgi:hypothetical protein
LKQRVRREVSHRGECAGIQTAPRGERLKSVVVLHCRGRDQSQRLGRGRPVSMERRTAFDGSPASGRGREPSKQSMDSAKIGMYRAPVQQRRIVPRGRGSCGEIRLV